MARKLPDEVLRKLECSPLNVTARDTGKSVRWHVARSNRLLRKSQVVRKESNWHSVQAPFGPMDAVYGARRLRIEKLRRREVQLFHAATAAWRDAVAQYKFDKSGYRAFHDRILRDVAAGFGIPYEEFTKGYASGGIVGQGKAGLVGEHTDGYTVRKIKPFKYPRYIGLSRHLENSYERIAERHYQREIDRQEAEKLRTDYRATYPDIAAAAGKTVVINTIGRRCGRLAAKRIEDAVLRAVKNNKSAVRAALNTHKGNITMSNALKIEVGKKYDTRDGRVAEVVYRNEKPSSPCEEFVIKVPSSTQPALFQTRTCNSRGWANSNDDGTGRNLVAEHVPFKLEVGGIYVTRDGGHRGIVLRLDDKHAAVRWLGPTPKHHAAFTSCYCFTDGLQNRNSLQPGDLVKKVAPMSGEEAAAIEMFRLADELLSSRADRRVTSDYEYTGYRIVAATHRGSNFNLTVHK